VCGFWPRSAAVGRGSGGALGLRWELAAEARPRRGPVCVEYEGADCYGSLPSDNGTVSIALAAVAPAVSSLLSPRLASPAFRPTGAADRAGHTQRLVLDLTNPLSTPVHVTWASLSGANLDPREG
jgi:hypothetical protein